MRSESRFQIRSQKVLSFRKPTRRALAAGTTTDKIFDMVESIQDKMHVPMVFMTYANVIFVYGIEKFCQTFQGNRHEWRDHSGCPV